MQAQNNGNIYKVAVTALLAALCYITFTFLKIPIPTPGGEYTALHVGNAFCVLAALLVGGGYGGLAGAIGMTIADLMSPVYLTYAPQTFVLKLIMGAVAGFVAHRVAHITHDHSTKYVFGWTLAASGCALGLNVILDPVFGYFYKRFVLGIQADAAMIMSTWSAGATLINAIIGTVVVVAVYMAVRPVLKKSGLFFTID